MTNETRSKMTDDKQISFGARLKAAREALGLDCKEAAAQLRLSEKIILMMEKDRYPDDLPVTFIRGYLRAYAKSLQIPEQEVKKAIELIKYKPAAQPIFSLNTATTPLTSGNYFMQFFTYLIVFTMIGLVGTWWYNHSNQPGAAMVAETQPQTADLPSTLTPTTQPLPISSSPSTPITTSPTDNNDTNHLTVAPKMSKPTPIATNTTSSTVQTPVATPSKVKADDAEADDVDDNDEEETDNRADDDTETTSDTAD